MQCAEGYVPPYLGGLQKLTRTVRYSASAIGNVGQQLRGLPIEAIARRCSLILAMSSLAREPAAQPFYVPDWCICVLTVPMLWLCQCGRPIYHLSCFPRSCARPRPVPVPPFPSPFSCSRSRLSLPSSPVSRLTRPVPTSSDLHTGSSLGRIYLFACDDYGKLLAARSRTSEA